MRVISVFLETESVIILVLIVMIMTHIIIPIMLLKKYKILKCVNTLSSSIGKLIMKRYCTQRYKCNICILYSNLFERKYCTYYIYRTLTVIYTVSVCCYKFTTPDYQYIPTRFTQLIDYC
jgi:hypothetical protein